jgi:hypothetical protein
MKLTTTTHVSLDGVMQGLGGADEDRSGGFERGGWAIPLFDNEAEAFLLGVFGRADAFLFGRKTYDIFAGSSRAARLLLVRCEHLARPRPDSSFHLERVSASRHTPRHE